MSEKFVIVQFPLNSTERHFWQGRVVEAWTTDRRAAEMYSHETAAAIVMGVSLRGQKQPRLLLVFHYPKSF